MKSYPVPIGIAIIQNKKAKTDEDVEKGETFLLLRMRIKTAIMKNSIELFKKLKIEYFKNIDHKHMI